MKKMARRGVQTLQATALDYTILVRKRLRRSGWVSKKKILKSSQNIGPSHPGTTQEKPAARNNLERRKAVNKGVTPWR